MRRLVRSLLPVPWLGLLLAACDGPVDPRAAADAALDAEPSWSPDGATIAFVRTGPRAGVVSAVRASREPGAPGVATSEVPPPRALLLVAAGGGAPRVLAHTVTAPAWLPDGGGLLATDPFRGRVVRVATDGTVRPVADTTALAFDPAVSRGGAVLVSTDRTDAGGRGGPLRLWLAAERALRRPLGPAAPGGGAGGSEQSTSPSWGPDGRVAFQRWRAADGPGFQIAIVDTAVGAAAVRVADGTAPAWSPTGEWIAYTRDATGGRGTLRLVRPDGTGDRPLIGGAEEGAVTGRAAWSPDGRFLAVPRVTRAHGAALWVVDAATGAARRLTAPRDAR